MKVPLIKGFNNPNKLIGKIVPVSESLAYLGFQLASENLMIHAKC